MPVKVVDVLPVYAISSDSIKIQPDEGNAAVEATLIGVVETLVMFEDNVVLPFWWNAPYGNLIVAPPVLVEINWKNV